MSTGAPRKRPSGNLAAKRARARDGRPDARRDGRAPQRPAPDRRPGRDVRPQLRFLLPLLSVARGASDRAVLTQQRRARNTPPKCTRSSTSRTPSPCGCSGAATTPSTWASSDGYGRQNPTEIPPGWERVARLGRSDYVSLLQLHAQRERHAAHLLREPGSVLLPDRRLPREANEIIKAPRLFFLWVSRSSATTRARPASPTPIPAQARGHRFRATPPRCAQGHRHASEAELQRGRRLRQASRDQEAPLLTAARIAAIQENWQQRREMLMSVDEAIASIVDGQLDNTLSSSPRAQRLLPRRALRREWQGALGTSCPSTCRGRCVAREQIAAKGIGANSPSSVLTTPRRFSTRRGPTHRRRRVAAADAGRRLGGTCYSTLYRAVHGSHAALQVRGVRKRRPGAVRPAQGSLRAGASTRIPRTTR